MLFLNSILVKAQVGDTLEIQRTENGHISFARFKFDNNRKLERGTNFLKNVLHTKPDDEFLLLKDTTDNLGISHKSYQQYYGGIKVENAEYAVHGKNGVIEIINGDFQDIVLPSITPLITEEMALGNALNYVNAKKYKWQDISMENLIKATSQNFNATYYPKGEKVITKDFLLGGNNFRLAWKFTISSMIPVNEQLIYVDAVTGNVIRNTPLVYDVNAPVNAQTRYSGVLVLTGDTFAGGFRLRETRNNVNVQTLNLQGTFNYAGAIDFANGTANFTNGNWANFNQNQVALDAHWGAEMVLDYWRVVHNRNSIDGNGIRVLSYIHAGANWNNAQWVGGVNNRFMQYGDGDGVILNPLTALDVCGHEMGHGITEFTAALVPGTQESGALNEGFSDIWGACVERRSAPAKQTWLIGEEIFVGAAFTCIRNMQNPKTNTAFEGQHPDTYHGQFWDNNGEPHNNSTVLSHWFFLLSQGGNGTNDLGNAFNVAGIGIDNAQLIAYRTELLYLTSTANYTAARNGSIQAARDLFGTNSCQEVAVTNAWYAVGVGTQFVNPSPTFLPVTGNGVVCGNTQTYTITGVPANTTISWQLLPPTVGSGYQLPSQNICTIATNGNQATLTKVSNGNVKLFATITNCGGVINYASKDVTFGVSSISNNGAYAPNTSSSWYTTITSTVHFTNGTTTAISMANPSNNTYTFTRQAAGSSANSSLIYWSNGNVGVVFTPPVNSQTKINLSVQTANACGTSNSPLVLYYNGPSSFFTVAPNPVSDVLSLQSTGDITNKSSQSEITINKIQIVNKMGLSVFNKFNVGVGRTFNFNISSLIPDVYTIIIYRSDGIEQHKFIKN